MEAVQPKALTVTQLNKYLKSCLDGDPRLKNVLLSGEISNFRRSSAGHCYFNLKDEHASIPVAMWRSYAGQVKFRMEDGQKVLAFGYVSMFEDSGKLQFYAQMVQPDGIGDLALAFEQLKEKLKKEGLFEKNQPIPRYPQKIGVVTSPTTAAFQDIQNVLSRRWPVAEVVLSPAMVQGNEAPPQIVSALQKIDHAGVDVILLCRGGGSAEDLWCFNDERVARAIYACKTPVISGVGHEIDFTISDFVADLRAPTPSAAAEVCTPDQEEERDRILHNTNRMRALLQGEINELRARVQFLQNSNVLRSFPSLLNEKRQKLDQLSDKLVRELDTRLMDERKRLAVFAGQLDAFNPLKVISRGYGVVRGEDGRVISKVAAAAPGDKIHIDVTDGRLNCSVDSIEQNKE